MRLSVVVQSQASSEEGAIAAEEDTRSSTPINENSRERLCLCVASMTRHVICGKGVPWILHLEYVHRCNGRFAKGVACQPALSGRRSGRRSGRFIQSEGTGEKKNASLCTKQEKK
jgi:hypothetical protein